MSKSIEKIKDFLESHNVAFDKPDKKAAFLLGVLTKFLLDVQLAARKSTPFRSKLSGLKLDENKLKRLFPEVIEKLEEYHVSYPEIEEYASKTLVEAENHRWRLSKNEISYYFALGLNLGGIFK